MLIQVVTTSSLLGRTIDLALVREAIALKSGSGSSLAPKTLATSEIEYCNGRSDRFGCSIIFTGWQ